MSENISNMYTDLDNLKDYWKYTYRRAGLGFVEGQSKQDNKKGVTKQIAKSKLVGDLKSRKNKEQKQEEINKFGMGLDIKDFRGKDMVKGDKGYIGNPDIIKESEKKRFRDPVQIDRVIDWEKQRLQTENLASNKRAEINAINKAIGQKKKVDKNDPCDEEQKVKQQLENDLLDLQKSEKESLLQRDIELKKIANIVHDSVPIFKDEENNKIERMWGNDKINKEFKITEEPGFCHHHQILMQIDGYDYQRGQKVAGHRGYFLKGYGFLLNQALIQYGIKFLTERGYTPIQPPYFMNGEAMGQTCQLSDFDEQLYRISSKHSTQNQTEEQKKNTQDEEKDVKYLIATSEQPISAMHSGEALDIKAGEPIKYAGFSTNFRKEAGSAGRDTWGLFRIHQFEKIEQFILCRPEESWEIHEQMAKCAEEFLQSLGLPYRVVNIVSGALNDAASKKYDIEAWYPGYQEYKELMSVSNCTDFQSRALNIRCGQKKKDEKIASYVHMLNGTLCATERTLTCILENYQEKEGLRVPQVLVPYVGTDFIKYTKNIVKLKDLQKQ